MEYPGIRFTMNAVMGKLVTPMKIDISTGDVITSRAIEYNYKLLLDDRSISLWSYNLETILAEKLQTVLARGLLNTRMRDFYDIKTLLSIYEQDIDADVLKKAFEANCKKRSTENLFTPIFSLSVLRRWAFLMPKRRWSSAWHPESRASPLRSAAIPQSSPKHWNGARI